MTYHCHNLSDFVIKFNMSRSSVLTIVFNLITGSMNSEMLVVPVYVDLQVLQASGVSGGAVDEMSKWRAFYNKMVSHVDLATAKINTGEIWLMCRLHTVSTQKIRNFRKGGGAQKFLQMEENVFIRRPKKPPGCML